MRSKTAIWFECKIRYEKVMEDGLQKKVTEAYVVDALSFSEAEERIIEEMSSYISGRPNFSSLPSTRKLRKRNVPLLHTSCKQALLMAQSRT